MRCLVAHIVLVFPGVGQGSAVGSPIHRVVALAGDDGVTAAAGLDQVIASATLHIVSAHLARCHFGGSAVNGVSPTGAVVVGSHHGLHIVVPAGVGGGDNLQIFFTIGKAQHLNIAQRIHAVAAFCFAVCHGEDGAIGICRPDHRVTLGLASVFGHIEAVGAGRVPLHGARRAARRGQGGAIGAAVQAVIAFVAAQGITTRAATQGVVALVAHEPV